MIYRRQSNRRLPQTALAAVPSAPTSQQGVMLLATLQQSILSCLTQNHSADVCFYELAQQLMHYFHADGCLMLTQAPAATLTGLMTHAHHSQAERVCLQGDQAEGLSTLLMHPAVINLRQSKTSRFPGDILSEVCNQANHHHHQPYHPQSLLVHPIHLSPATQGALVLMQTQAITWTTTDIAALDTLSDCLAIALHHLQVHQALHRQTQHCHVTNDVAQVLRQADTLQAALKAAMTCLVNSLGISQGQVFLLKYTNPLQRTCIDGQVPPATVQLTCEVSDASLPTLVEITPDPAPTNLAENPAIPTFDLKDCPTCQQVLLQAPKPLVLQGAKCFAADVSTKQMHPMAALPSPISSTPSTPLGHHSDDATCLLVPLEHQNTILGILALQHHQPRPWHSDELCLVHSVATQLSTAIIQSQTLRQVQSLVNERTAQLQRSLEVQGKLYEQSRRHNEQLRHLNQLKDDFVNTMSHELRTPLTSMTLAIRMLRRQDLPPERRDTYLDILEQQCVQETNLINDLLALQKLETQVTSLQVAPVNLAALLQDVTGMLADKFVAAQLSLDLDLPAQTGIETEPESLKRILIELLTNARKYATAESTVHLTVNYGNTPQSKSIYIQVTNQGLGIAPDELPYIFEKFRRGQGITEKAIQGTGLGLSLVKQLVDHLQGQITISSQPLLTSTEWETCVVVELPRSYAASQTLSSEYKLRTG